MYIETIISKMTSFPLSPVFEIHIPLKDEVLKVHAKMVRLVQSADFYEGMGVKLLDIPPAYLEFLIRLNLGSCC